MNRRTTVTAREEDLAVLAHEAQIRGTSLGKMIGEAVAMRADQLRQDRRPRVGTFEAKASIAKLAEREEPAARSFRDN
jgi:hypothetical protein